MIRVAGTPTRVAKYLCSHCSLMASSPGAVCLGRKQKVHSRSFVSLFAGFFFFSVFQAKCSFDEHYLVFVSVVFFAKCLKVTLSRSATKTAYWKPSDESHSLEGSLLWEGGEGRGDREESFHVTEG